MAAVLMPEGRQSFEDSAGQPLVGGKLYTYVAGTSAPQGTWVDAAQTTPNTNPIILDARGEATIFWTGSYKVVLFDANDVLIWTVDNVTTPEPAGSAAALRAELQASTFTPKFLSVEAGGNPLLTPGTVYYADKTITSHGNYGFIDNSTVSYAVPGFLGQAAFNDNRKYIGSVASDHVHSYQSYVHYGTAANVGVVSSFWSQLDATAGNISEASGLKFNNPLGAGTITNLCGVLIDNLTRGTNNWGIFSKADKSFLGGVMHYGDTVGTSYTTLGYNGDGYLTATPRATFAFRIAGIPGNSARLNIGAIGGAANDSILEQEATGRTRLAPRPGFGILLDGSTEISNSLVMGAPIIERSTTVALLNATFPAASWTYGRCMVSDATVTTFASIVAGGGANRVPVYSDGTNWRIG
jgi:hypothetical protein